MFKFNSKFRALYTFKNKKNFNNKFMTTSFNEVKKKEVVVKLNYSSINQKDYLVTRGKFWGNKKFSFNRRYRWFWNNSLFKK